MTLLATHVGSLPRPQQVVDFLFAREKGEPHDPAAFDACMAAAVMENVRRQKAAGIDIVSDGGVEDQLRHLCQGPLHRL